MEYEIQNTPPLAKDEPKYLYHQESYIALNKKKTIPYYLVKGNNLVASIHFDILDKTAISQQYAPFGGFIAYGIQSAYKKALSAFILKLEQSLEAQGIKEAIIHCAAENYHPKQSNQSLFALLDMGWHVQELRINHHLDLSQSFETGLHPMELRKLKKLSASGIIFSIDEDLGQSYDFVLACRKKEKQTLSLKKVAFMKLVKAFPNHYHSYSIFKNKKRMATVITVQVSEKVVYAFYPATSPDFRSLSPMVALTDHLVKHLQAKNMDQLDLGTSYFKGKSIKGLMQFKERIGGHATLKFSFSKHF